MTSPAAGFKKILSFLNRLEEILLGSFLILMVLLGFIQILFRNVLSVGLYWIDPLLRHSVLWVALLGASVATRENRHISIDLLPEKLGDKSRSYLQGGINLFAAVICLILVHPAIRFVQEEYAVGKILAFHIPIWFSQSVIPLMLSVLGLRFLGKTWQAFNHGREFLSSEKSESNRI
ncbi:MAG: TRAP transporter small permease [Deltaproteobacteria bacterium]|nr:TRAP transporter small permease [Deltaproteobacteria bacterium]